MRRAIPPLLVAVIALTAADPAAGQAPAPAADGAATAACGTSMRGPGIPLSQAPTQHRGRLGIFLFTPDFRDLQHHGDSFAVKAPIGVRPGAPVTLRVPEPERHRVALTYSATGSGRARLAEVTFEPCPDKARTAWPGGLILHDRKPITLEVALATGGPVHRLRLGRP